MIYVPFYIAEQMRNVKMKLKYKLLTLMTSILAIFALFQVSQLGFAELYPTGGQGGP